MYQTEVLRSVMFSNRTCVEDLDLTWELVSRGYKVTQSTKAIIFSQEAASFRDDLKRWRRWISGYAVCMRIHKRLLLSRFGLAVILPNFLMGLLGAVLMVIPFVLDYKSALNGRLAWLVILVFASGYSARRQNQSWWLICYSPFSVVMIVTVFFCWLIWGIPSLVAGSSNEWQKVRRY